MNELRAPHNGFRRLAATLPDLALFLSLFAASTMSGARAQDAEQGFMPRRVALAAGALGFAILAGLALGSVPALTQGTSRVSFATVGNVAPASPTDQAGLEDLERRSAVQQLARAMLKTSLADQATALKGASAPATDATAAPDGTALTTTGTNASAGLDPQDMEWLANKAAESIRNGDIASARLVLARAARAGDAAALYALAETYDPRVLVKLRVQGMQGEPDTARNLYQRALDRGVEEARQRL